MGSNPVRRPGFYERRIFPWLNDWLNVDPELIRIRREALAPARGSVVEIGFGTGANLPHYPPGIEHLVGIEPSLGMRERAARSMKSWRVPVEILSTSAVHIERPDRSFDTAVTTLTLCSVDQPEHVLRELGRVLKDEGRLIVLEHGLSEDPKVARWQHRLNGLQNAVACGCNLNRPIEDLVVKSGFRFETLHKFYMKNTPRPLGWINVGRAVKARVQP